MTDYIPPALDWVREQVELYEGSSGTEGTTLRDTGMPCIIVTHTGNKTGGIRKIPLMRVRVEDSYVLIGSYGGRPKDPVWVYNLRANPNVEIRDKADIFKMHVREVTNDAERRRIWDISAEVFPPYNDYQAKAPRQIPVFLAEPV
jgi:deazaflavin-dependent oxidoreductase (nitroreductase family)